MSSPETSIPGSCEDSTGAHQDVFQVAPVSHFWAARLEEIDSTWNPKSWSKQLFERELAEPLSQVRGLFCDEVLVGYLIAHTVLDESHIVSLGLDPQWRRRGGGRFLLQDFLRYSRLQGVNVITLEVRISNLTARALYEACGFSVVGLRRNYYSDNNEDALTMRYEFEVLHPSERAALEAQEEQEERGDTRHV